MEKKGIHVHCPQCGNKRLFDNISALYGTIEIKCPECRQVVAIDLERVTSGKRHLEQYRKKKWNKNVE